MKNKTLTAIMLLLGTFCIGIVVGMTLQPRLARNKPEWIRGMMDPGIFAGLIIEAADATPEQAEAIEPILRQTSRELRDIFEDHRKQARVAIDEMWEEISTHITDQQMERLEHRLPRRLQPGGGGAPPLLGGRPGEGGPPPPPGMFREDRPGPYPGMRPPPPGARPLRPGEHAPEPPPPAEQESLPAQSDGPRAPEYPVFMRVESRLGRV